MLCFSISYCQTRNKGETGNGIENRNAVDSAPLETQLETSLEVQLRQEHFSNKRLKTRVDELEQQLQSIQQANIVDEFKHEFSLLMSECDMLSFGPDSLEHLQSFSLSGVIHEIQTNAPVTWAIQTEILWMI